MTIIYQEELYSIVGFLNDLIGNTADASVDRTIAMNSNKNSKDQKSLLFLA